MSEFWRRLRALAAFSAVALLCAVIVGVNMSQRTPSATARASVPGTVPPSGLLIRAGERLAPAPAEEPTGSLPLLDAVIGRQAPVVEAVAAGGPADRPAVVTVRRSRPAPVHRRVTTPHRPHARHHGGQPPASPGRAHAFVSPPLGHGHHAGPPPGRGPGTPPGHQPGHGHHGGPPGHGPSAHARSTGPGRYAGPRAPQRPASPAHGHGHGQAVAHGHAKGHANGHGPHGHGHAPHGSGHGHGHGHR